MDNLFAFAAHNTAVALVFALFVSAVTRVWRNPPVVHVLWLLVLLRLVAPPVLLPWFVQTKDTAARAGSSDDKAAAPAPKPDTTSSSEFPFAVKFEQGATRFLDGDKITIVEVRGTADTFAPGNIYWIKGTYTLASHDRAMLAAFTTARDAAYGKGSSLKVQTALVNRGEGTFTLFLPMAYSGWPHISFYPADSGASFGGNYFGTGDSVLKQWWGTKKKENK